jgi:hypothetical protein
VPSEYGVRRFTVHVNCGIASANSPIGKILEEVEVLTIDPSGFGVLNSTRMCTQGSRERECRFPDLRRGDR